MHGLYSWQDNRTLFMRFRPMQNGTRRKRRDAVDQRVRTRNVLQTNVVGERGVIQRWFLGKCREQRTHLGRKVQLPLHKSDVQRLDAAGTAGKAERLRPRVVN